MARGQRWDGGKLRFKHFGWWLMAPACSGTCLMPAMLSTRWYICSRTLNDAASSLGRTRRRLKGSQMSTTFFSSLYLFLFSSLPHRNAIMQPFAIPFQNPNQAPPSHSPVHNRRNLSHFHYAIGLGDRRMVFLGQEMT